MMRRLLPIPLILSASLALTSQQAAHAQLNTTLAFAKVIVNGSPLQGDKVLPSVGGIDLKDYFQLRSFEYEILKPSATGDTKPGAVKITKFIDQATPPLAQALDHAEEIEVEIILLGVDPQSGASIKTATWTLTAARVIADRVWMPEAGVTSTGLPTQEVQFSFQRLDITHDPSGWSTSISPR